MNTRTKTILGGVATVVVLAGVILGLSAISAPKKGSVTPPTIEYTAAQQSQAAYTAGQQALASGDTTAAIADFKKAIQLDPSNTAAQQQLTEVTNASTAASTSSSSSKSSTTAKKTSGSSSTAVDWTGKSLSSLKTLLPSKFTDYTLGQPTASNSYGSVSATAVKASAPASHVEWEVLDRTSATGATTFVNTSKTKLYTQDGADTTVNGVSAYFGTDGKTFAAVVYRRGRYVFQVVLTAPKGSPGSLKTVAEQAAAAFPTAP